MIAIESMAAVALIALGIVLTPGPNMIYLVSRSISQGRLAGLISLAGVVFGFVFYMLTTALGLATLFETFPAAFNIIRIAGAIYLGYLAWNIIKPKGRLFFETQDLKPYSPARLFTMGFITNLLNPKIALMYVALISQFIDSSIGSTFSQFIQLGLVQITIATSVNALIVLVSSSMSSALKEKPQIMNIQRWLSGMVLGGFAVNLLLQ